MNKQQADVGHTTVKLISYEYIIQIRTQTCTCVCVCISLFYGLYLKQKYFKRILRSQQEHLGDNIKHKYVYI